MNQSSGLIDKILKNTDIVELINEVTTLEKKGKNHMGLCPFHEEKTPSFSVSEDKQLYHCFSCKKSGNAITFVEDTKGLERREAIKLLAERANIDIRGDFKQDPKEKYYAINQKAIDFFKVNLNHTNHGKTALRYLENRQIDSATIETFDIGLAPNQKDALYKALKKDEHFDSDLRDLALIGQQDPPFDQFRNRIMFPLHDAAGRPVGFSGRIYTDDNQTAKYMNSPGTVTFEKSKVLYNLNRAKKTIKEKKRAVLFEGFMDVIMAHQAGIEEGLAVMGTALSQHHIRLIKEHTDTLILCFDGDQAGIDATVAMIETLKKTSLHVLIAPLPAGKDPDDYIRENGKAAFRNVIDDALSLLDFLYDHHIKNVNPKKIMDVERFKKQIFNLIKPLSSVQVEHYIERLSRDLNVTTTSLKQDLMQIRQPVRTPVYQPVKAPIMTDKFRRAERGFIHYFIKDEHYSRRFRKEFEDVTYIDKEARDIQFEIFEHYDLRPQSCIVTELLKGRLTKKQRQYFEDHIDVDNYPYNEREFEDFIKVMHEYNRRNRIKHIHEQINKTDDIEEKIILKQQIDRMIKEDNDGKRKNHTRTH